MRVAGWLIVLIAVVVRAPDFVRVPAAVHPARAAGPRLPASRADAGSQPVGPTGIVLPVREPMALEMQRELQRGQLEYAASFRRLAAARDEQEALAIEEDMRQQRIELQIALLRIQSAYARRAGRSAFADQLERAIDVLIATDPPRPEAPPSGSGL